MHPHAEQAAHAGAHRLRIEQVHAGADHRQVLHAESQRRADNRPNVPAVARAVQHHMRPVLRQAVGELLEYRCGKAVVLAADPGQRPVGFLHADPQPLRLSGQLSDAFPSRRGGMNQDPAHLFRPVQQAFHSRKDPRGIAVIQVAPVTFQRRHTFFTPIRVPSPPDRYPA